MDNHREPTVDPLIGLLGWLAALEGHANAVQRDAATVIVPDRRVAMSFQLGCARTTGPFLAYPPPLWWFAGAWRGVAVGPAGLAVIATSPDPLAVVLRSDWPLTLAEVEREVRRTGGLALYAFAPAYWASLLHGDGARRPLAQVADLDPVAGAFLDCVDGEVIPWLDPFLRSLSLDFSPAIRP